MATKTPTPSRLPSRKRVLPDLVGLHVDDAQIVLRSAGFPPGQVHFTESYGAEDSVVSQDPPRGHMVDSSAVVKLHVIKQSLVRHLPSVYQMSGTGVDSDFLRRYLWIFHHLHDSLQGNIDSMDRLFRPLETREDFLPWLASWLALTLDPDWPVDRKRRLIRRAAELYNIRGTARALRIFLEIFTGLAPEVEENRWPHRGFQVGVSSVVGVDAVILPPMNRSHCFIVRLPFAADEITEDALMKIHQIIQNEKPAHTIYWLDFAEKRRESGVLGIMQIGVGSAIGSGLVMDEAPEEPAEP
ncbi:MAG: hypothetical protein AMXMBFR64_24130 [Myxococcales bacterium]